MLVVLRLSFVLCIQSSEKQVEIIRHAVFGIGVSYVPHYTRLILWVVEHHSYSFGRVNGCDVQLVLPVSNRCRQSHRARERTASVWVVGRWG